MVAKRPLDKSPNGIAEDLRKHVIRLLEANDEAPRSNILVLPQVFLEFLNYDHKMALFLNQLLYWTQRSQHPQKWVYRTYHEWYDELGFKESVIRRLIHGDASIKTRKRTLKDIGVEVRVKRAPNGSPTCHYRLNLDVFLDAIHRFGSEKQLLDSPAQSVESPEWNPANPEDGSGDSLVMDLLESAGTLDQKTTPQISSEDLARESSGTDDDDFQLFHAYGKRFGKLKEAQRTSLQTELDRLGRERVGEVLERCSTRGRSWHYVQRALANEIAAEVVPQTPSNERYGGLLTFSGAEGLNIPAMSAEALQSAASDRIHTVWNPEGVTVLEAWSAAFQQLELQFDRATFVNYIRDTVLVDYDPATVTFVVLTSSTPAREMLHHRLARTVRRILGDILQHEVKLAFVVSEDWAGEPTSSARSA